MSGHMDRLVIVGRDAPLWLAASVVAKALAPAGVMVQAIELPSALTVSDVYASHPALEALHNQLRIDETALLRTTGGAFSLGQNFSDATARVPAFLHAFGGYGSAIDGQDFFGFWLKARRYGLNVPLDDFSLTASAARQGRLLIPDDDTERYARSDYGYHLPAAAYAAYLKSVAQTVGVQAEEASSVAIDRDAATGDVKALMLDGGRRIDGDLFFDLDGALSRDTAEWLDWHQYLPFDRVAVARGERFRAIPVYADERASPTGLTGLYPAQAGTYVVHGWASGLCDDNTALGQMAAVAGMPLMDTTVRTIAPGRLANAWVGNCVALGAAACLLAPLHDLDLLALQAGLVELLGRFPATAAFAAERQDYNRVMAGTYDHLRD
ncbi:MAG: tryptophan halogenase, partial [Alphaproteobacteria bacterium]